MRLTTRSNLAMRTLMYCAANPGKTVRKTEIAQTCQVSENHLAQVIHLLARDGYLATQRGRSGGMRLARPASEITVGAVFRSFEKVLPFTECSDERASTCPLAGVCRLKCVLSDALDAFYAKLDVVTVADLVEGNHPLQDILRAA